MRGTCEVFGDITGGRGVGIILAPAQAGSLGAAAIYRDMLDSTQQICPLQLMYMRWRVPPHLHKSSYIWINVQERG